MEISTQALLMKEFLVLILRGLSILVPLYLMLSLVGQFMAEYLTIKSLHLPESLQLVRRTLRWA